MLYEFLPVVLVTSSSFESFDHHPAGTCNLKVVSFFESLGWRPRPTKVSKNDCSEIKQSNPNRSDVGQP